MFVIKGEHFLIYHGAGNGSDGGAEDATGRAAWVKRRRRRWKGQQQEAFTYELRHRAGEVSHRKIDSVAGPFESEGEIE